MKLKSFITVGAATFSSRLLGFLRDSLVASAMGAGPVAEAYTVANRLANMFRKLFAEGAFATAFIPTYTGVVEKDGRFKALEFASEATSLLIYALIAVTFAAEIFMVELTLLLAPGFLTNPVKLEAAVLMGRILFPFLTIISVTTVYNSILFHMEEFRIASFSQLFLNIFILISLVIIVFTSIQGTVVAGVYLSFGTLLGAICQMVIVIMACWIKGAVLRLTLPSFSVNVRQLYRLAIPGIIAGGVAQINIMVGTAIASTQDGAVVWLYYADRLYQLPLGIVGITIATVILPDFSRYYHQGDVEKVNFNLNRSMEFAALFTIPAAVSLVFFSRPLVAGLFQYGQFTSYDTLSTALVVTWFGLGLPAFIGLKVFQPIYFAQGDAYTPLKFSILNVIVNVALSLALFPFIGYVACAIATSLSGWLNFLLLYYRTSYDGFFKPDGQLLSSILKVILASAAMVSFVSLSKSYIWFFGETHQIGDFLYVLIISPLVFFGILFLIGGLSILNLRRQNSND